MKLPEPDIWRDLGRLERLAYRMGAAVNEHPMLKAAATAWLTSTSHRWMGAIARALLEVDGAKHVPHDRSLLLVANHRTYFDFYAAALHIWDHRAEKPFLYCPVRSAFFYDHPLGSVLNAGIAGYAMYPPVFRDQRAGLNRHAMDRCADLLRWSPRTIVAIHPEGRRNKTDDPYAFLEPKPGAGIIAHRARATVVPLFVNGLAHDLVEQSRRRLAPERSEPIRVFFGPSLALDDLYDQSPTREVHRAIVERMMDGIRACAARERVYMASRSS